MTIASDRSTANLSYRISGWLRMGERIVYKIIDVYIVCIIYIFLARTVYQTPPNARLAKREKIVIRRSKSKKYFSSKFWFLIFLNNFFFIRSLEPAVFSLSIQPPGNDPLHPRAFSARNHRNLWSRLAPRSYHPARLSAISPRSNYVNNSR